MSTRKQDAWVSQVLGINVAAPSHSLVHLAKSTETPLGAQSGPISLDIEFNAFIQGTFGKPASSFGYPADFKNQEAFNAQVQSIGGTWLLEPGDLGRFKGYGPWIFETDNREFGGGSHRIGSRGKIEGTVGQLGSQPKGFVHGTSGSSRYRYRHDGILSSSGATGWIEKEGPKNSKVTGAESRSDKGSTSFIAIRCKGTYPFATIAPAIDYYVGFHFTTTDGITTLECDIQSNVFPSYELLLNGTVVWSFCGKGGGPGLLNLTVGKQKSSYTQKL